MSRASTDFDGVNDHLGLNSSTPAINSTPRTIMAWVRPTSLTGNPNVFMTTGDNWASNHYRLVLRVLSSGKIYGFRWHDSQNNTWQTDTSPVTVNTWSHIGIRQSTPGGGMGMFYNGVSQATTQVSIPSGAAPSETKYKVAEMPNAAGQNWTGQLAYLCLYNRFLSVSEMESACWSPGSIRDGLQVFLPLIRDFADYTSNEYDVDDSEGTSASDQGPPVSPVL